MPEIGWNHLLGVAIWALIATAALTSILAGSQGMGLTRLSLPFLLGSFVTGNRHRAAAVGFVLYLIGGFLFAFLYFLFMGQLGAANWWIGAMLGALHGLFLLTALLPVLPHVHPRMATEYDGPSGQRRLEPPGFLGLNYGYRTPLTTVIGHAVYGAILGAGYVRLLEQV
jgi:hypothetical protein